MRYKTTAEVYRQKHGHDMPSYADMAKPRRGDSIAAQTEKARVRAVLRGEDVESKEASYLNLNLQSLWGSL
jgi:hypothetical protein